MLSLLIFSKGQYRCIILEEYSHKYYLQLESPFLHYSLWLWHKHYQVPSEAIKTAYSQIQLQQKAEICYTELAA